MSTSLQPEKQKRIEINSTILLSLAALAVTWCSYQSNLWNGVQNFKLAESNIYSRKAQQNTLIAAQKQEIDAAIAIEFLNAVIDKRQDRIDFYLTRGKSQMRSVLNAWLATDPLHNEHAPPHPLAMKEYVEFVQASLAATDSANIKAEALWDKAQHANSVSDQYTLATVIFSLVMFLGALASKMTHIKMGYTCMVLAALIFIIILLLIFTMPVRWKD